MNYILFDGNARNSLLPFTYTRPVADIRIGILTIREKWEKHLKEATSTITEKYLEEKYPMAIMKENILINASFLPSPSLIKKIKQLSKNEGIFINDEPVAFYTAKPKEEVNFDTYTKIELEEELIQIKNTWDIFSLNEKAIQLDFELLTKGRKSESIPEGTRYLNKKAIFIEKGATITFATLNASKGPIYIGKNATIMENSSVRGPFAMCHNAILKMGAKIYGATTLGPFCKVAGEINNTVLFGYSSKGHEGYLGNSVLGEWCNIGADSNNSNLKNNYTTIKLWNYQAKRFTKTGLQFCGLIMGDHSKCGINTMFNTGTVVGVSTNIYGSGFPRNFIPSFSWGGPAGFINYQLHKVLEVATIVMKRRGIIFSEVDEKIFQHLFEETKQYRNY